MLMVVVQPRHLKKPFRASEASQAAWSLSLPQMVQLQEHMYSTAELHRVSKQNVNELSRLKH